MDNAELQRRLTAHGYDVGPADGLIGPRTLAAIRAYAEARLLAEGQPAPLPVPAGAIVPADWMPAARMERVICHWTAGGHKASTVDREHYHILVEADGHLVRGDHSIDDNVNTQDRDYAAHTLNCNTGSIGVSVCCMLGAVESPFNAGVAPMLKSQWDKMAVVVAELCRRYAIQVSPRTVLSHAEVQSTLGIAQRGKWDFTRLAFDASAVGAKACGDRLRAQVQAALR